VLGTVLVGALLVVGLFFVGYSMVKIPDANALATKQSNVYLYADGTEIARDGAVNRENVTLAQISKEAQHAVLAAEDRDFYTESAIDPKAMIRAGWNTATGKGKQSGSTITQQYVKNYYLAQEQTVTRKVKEFFISIKLDREQPKDEILEGYLNTSYFGRNAYGIQAAAQAYYGVDARELTAPQGAYLAALLNAPSEYDVIAHPENKAAAEARWNYVLDGMVKKGWLAEAKRQGTAFPTPREESAADTGMSGQRGYIVRAIRDHLTQNKIVTEAELDGGGYRITTTLEKSKQDAFVDAVNDKLMSKLDKKSRKVDGYVRAGGAAVEPKTGKVLAMYGGIDYVKQYTNNATRRDFQVGSTFKPFVFTAAVQHDSETQDGRPITPNTVYDGTNERPVQGWTGGGYAPENEDQHSYGDISVREATDKSVNAVYAQLAVDVGPAKVKQTAIDLGLPTTTPDLQPYPSIALGTATASVLDMAEAYATLANHGRHGAYTLIDKVTKDGKDVVELPGRKTSQVVSREAADTHHLDPAQRRPERHRHGRPGRRPPGRGQDRHRGEGHRGLVRRLHARPRHRRRRDGPGPGHRRAQAPVRRDGPAADQRRRGAHRDLGAVHPEGPQGHPGARLQPPAPGGFRTDRLPVRRALGELAHRGPGHQRHAVRPGLAGPGRPGADAGPDRRGRLPRRDDHRRRHRRRARHRRHHQQPHRRCDHGRHHVRRHRRRHREHHGLHLRRHRRRYGQHTQQHRDDRRHPAAGHGPPRVAGGRAGRAAASRRPRLSGRWSPSGPPRRPAAGTRRRPGRR
jgi:membrane peptidoglycan carboxypeptidase